MKLEIIENLPVKTQIELLKCEVQILDDRIKLLDKIIKDFQEFCEKEEQSRH